MGRGYEGSIIYHPTLKSQCLDVHIKGIPIFFRGERSNPVSTFTEDIKWINLTSIKDDGMISQALYNFVLNRLE